MVASKLAGEPTWRIMLYDIVPNLLPIMAASFIGGTTYAMGAQVGLEFLGLGDLSVVTWGTTSTGLKTTVLLTGAWWTYVPSGLGLALIGYLLTVLNRSLDEIANPRLGDQRAWLQHLGKKSTRAWLHASCEEGVQCLRSKTWRSHFGDKKNRGS